MMKFFNDETKVFDFGYIKVIPKMNYTDLINKRKKIHFTKWNYPNNCGFDIHYDYIYVDQMYYKIDLSFIDSHLKFLYISIYNNNEVREIRKNGWSYFNESKQSQLIERYTKWLKDKKITNNHYFTVDVHVRLHDVVPKIRIEYS